MSPQMIFCSYDFKEAAESGTESSDQPLVSISFCYTVSLAASGRCCVFAAAACWRTFVVFLLFCDCQPFLFLVFSVTVFPVSYWLPVSGELDCMYWLTCQRQLFSYLSLTLSLLDVGQSFLHLDFAPMDSPASPH